uniref:hypothetical protein n=1 Tax=uncultured Dysgonomonas sp. TaxID=206096 RepID=UPI0026220055|nr:hypothetical protein [uncultured Dysgonomonas sp.]
MTRKDLQTINNDREIIDLRMQAEELINNVESLSDEDFRNEAKRIEKEIDDRIAVLIQQMEG